MYSMVAHFCQSGKRINKKQKIKLKKIEKKKTVHKNNKIKNAYWPISTQFSTEDILTAHR